MEDDEDGRRPKWKTTKIKDNKLEDYQNTPGTRGGPGDSDWTLAVKSQKLLENQFFFRKKIEIN